MSLVIDIFKQHLPHRSKKTPSGWTSFNAPCCHHRGHAADTRQRGGVTFSDGLVFNCFNCGYTASWKPGRQIGQKLKNLMRWFGAPEDDINKMVFEALKAEAPEIKEQKRELVVFPDKQLPEGSLLLSEWIDQELDAELDQKLANAVNYLVGRGIDPLGEFYWSPLDGMDERVIIPFKYTGRTVGWTARKVKDGKPKYLSDQQPHFVFNMDSVTQEQEYVFVVEGPFDALAVHGLALLHNEISEEQARLINKLGKTVIVIPDQDRAGASLISDALKYDWHVAFPNWDDDVKDCADAVSRYGKLFVMVDAMNTAVSGAIKINLYKKQFERKVK